MKIDANMKCKNCEGDLRRRSRASLVSFWLSCLCIYPYRCRRCARDTTRVNWEQAALFYSILVLALCLLTTGAAWYRAKHRPPPRPTADETAVMPAAIDLSSVLTNQDVVDMTRAKLGPDIMIHLIRNSPHNFQIDPRALIQLKQEGTDDQVISTMIEATPPAQPKSGNPILAKLMIRVEEPPTEPRGLTTQQ